MTKLRDYQSWKLQKLGDPEFAAHYLKEAAKSSPDTLLRAIKNVAQAREISAVAKEAGVARENLYRAFSAQGNPTYDTLTAVLGVLGLRLSFESLSQSSSPTPTHPVSDNSLGFSSQSSHAATGSMGSSGEKLFSGLYVAYTNPNAPKFKSGIGQQRRALRSAHG